MEELGKYQDRMGYTEESMQSMRYKMSVYDDFNDEYDYRVKYDREHPSKNQRNIQEQIESQEKQIVTPVRRKGRGRQQKILLQKEYLCAMILMEICIKGVEKNDDAKYNCRTAEQQNSI